MGRVSVIDFFDAWIQVQMTCRIVDRLQYCRGAAQSLPLLSATAQLLGEPTTRVAVHFVESVRVIFSGYCVVRLQRGIDPSIRRRLIKLGLGWLGVCVPSSGFMAYLDATNFGGTWTAFRCKMESSWGQKAICGSRLAGMVTRCNE